MTHNKLVGDLSHDQSKGKDVEAKGGAQIAG